MDIEKFDRILKVRVIVSAVVFAVFVAVSFHGVITGWHFDQPTPAVVLLLLSFFSWPRRAKPKGWKPDTESTRGRQEAQARPILQRRIDKMRLFYFFSAFFLLFLLPIFLGEPILQG